ncbi:transglycosylase domain-containing protein [Priestia sp. D3YE.R1]|uniref:transglycosylase domain-containing protein n=1 Tax=Priestia sp. D3YE.R1 TaxID=3400416 RepID=UPI003B9E814C
METVLTEHLKKARRVFRILLVLGILAGALLLFAYISIFLYAKIAGPPPLNVSQTAVFYSANGKVLDEVHNGQKRYWVSLNQISPYVKDATLAVEDKRFYEHHGFDMHRIAGAIVADIKAMGKVQGASTITQQYARNLFLEHDKTWTRKLQEALYTIRLEMNYSKDQILEGYINTIYYGHGAYGIEAAARLYFDKHAKNLTLSEASMLAGIPKGPSYYSPLIHQENAKKRQNIILSLMKEDGIITAKQATKALVTPLAFAKPAEKDPNKEDASYFMDAALAELKQDLGIDETMIYTNGLRVYTTLDEKMQRTAEEKMKDVISSSSDVQSAFVAMNPKNGQVKALIGGRDYEKSPFNRATQAIRQPGSTMKPFLYYAALKDGFTESTPMKSEETTFKLEDGVSTYTPSNYHNYYADAPITMAQAIALSDNIYAVKTHLFIGENRLIETAKTLGISSPLKKVPSLALGTSPVKVIDMVNAYGIFANGGKEIRPTFIKRIETHDGEVVYQAPSERKQVIDKRYAFLTTHLMTGMFNQKLNGYTTVTGKPISKYVSRPYAGKSGTTSTDSWMIGYSPQLVSGVWVGYDQGRTMDDVAEKGYAKKMWALFMEDALKGKKKEKFKAPNGLMSVNINPQNGKLASKSCPVQYKAYYLTGTQPKTYCTDHIDHAAKTKKKQHEAENKKFHWLPKWFD